jgi:dTDP-4-amino-4,6-dideoxygalactose transaminase
MLRVEKSGGLTEAVPVFKPLLEQEELAAAQRSLEAGWLGMGADVAAFERALSAVVGAPGRHVAAVSTGHAALHIAFLLAGLEPGDEVITPSFNNVADFQAILATGARPVFCDIDERTLCIDPAKVEELIGPKTRAIVAMDYACHLCEHDAIADVAARRGLRVIHDGAHAIGSQYNGKPIGSFSDVTIFSFDPVKTFTTIDGGAIVVTSEEELKKVHEMRLIGMGQSSSILYQNERAWTYDVARLGFRYHLANLHGAVGVAQLEKRDRIARTRRETFAYYGEQLKDIEGLRIPACDLEAMLPFLFYVRVPDGRRDELRAHLQRNGVNTGIHWQPGHWFSLFKDCRRGDLTVTERVGREILTIPFHSAMARATQDRVVEAIRSFSW